MGSGRVRDGVGTGTGTGTGTEQGQGGERRERGQRADSAISNDENMTKSLRAHNGNSTNKTQYECRSSIIMTLL